MPGRTSKWRNCMFLRRRREKSIRKHDFREISTRMADGTIAMTSTRKPPTTTNSSREIKITGRASGSSIRSSNRGKLWHFFALRSSFACRQDYDSMYALSEGPIEMTSSRAVIPAGVPIVSGRSGGIRVRAESTIQLLLI